MNQNIPREIDGAVKYEDIVEEFKKRKRRNSRVLRNGHSMIGFLSWHQGKEPRKRFQYCLNPNSSRHTSYFRAIHGQSRGIAIDPELQDNVLLPKGFTDYICHVGNVSEVQPIIRSGLSPGGQSLKRGGQSVFFTIVNPMEDQNCVEETSCDLTKPRVVPYKNTWKPHQNIVYWCNLKLAQEKGLLFPDKVACNRPQRHTTCCLHRESGMHEDEG